MGSEGSVDHTVWNLHVLSVEWRQEIHGQAGMVSPEELHTRGGQRGQLSSGLEEETWYHIELSGSEKGRDACGTCHLPESTCPLGCPFHRGKH